MKISVVINTLNEAENLPRALQSVKDWADEIVIVDMHSEDETVKIAKKYGAKVFEHERTGYVEPARNFAISKATGEWILLLDADEEVPESLGKVLQGVALQEENALLRGPLDSVEVGVLQRLDLPPDLTFLRLPRKNLIFNQWIQHSRWWPDYNIRFFKKGSVTWDETIHSVPMTRGEGYDLPAKEEFALIHHHYQTISQYIQRLDRYTTEQLRALRAEGYEFAWQDLLIKPANEFFSRYFAAEGYKDGLHGLALALLQAVSELVLYLKAWEGEKFPVNKVSIADVDKTTQQLHRDLLWWLGEIYRKQGNLGKGLTRKLKRLLS